MTKNRTFRRLIFFALAIGLLLVLLVPPPAPNHAPNADLALIGLCLVLLFVEVDFRRTLLRTGFTIEHAVSASPTRRSLFQRPPPQV